MASIIAMLHNRLLPQYISPYLESVHVMDAIRYSVRSVDSLCCRTNLFLTDCRQTEVYLVREYRIFVCIFLFIF